MVFLVADSVHQKTDSPGRSVEQDEHLGSLLRIKSKDGPGEVPGLSNMLGDLQEVINTRILVEESYQMVARNSNSGALEFPHPAHDL